MWTENQKLSKNLLRNLEVKVKSFVPVPSPLPCRPQPVEGMGMATIGEKAVCS